MYRGFQSLLSINKNLKTLTKITINFIFNKKKMKNINKSKKLIRLSKI